MNCEVCKQNPAKVRVTEIVSVPGAKKTARDRLLCDSCADGLGQKVFHSVALSPEEILKLLQQHAQRARTEGDVTCPECGMSLAEFRSKGRFGCAADYQVFRTHVEPLLLRVHSALEHKGRVPGEDRVSRELSNLRTELEAAVRSEAYEKAAQLRDRILGLEAGSQGPSAPAAGAPMGRASGPT